MSPKTATILNVNDHEQTRYMVTRMLEVAGFQVLEAASGEDALRQATGQPDLVILDIKLPDISGLEVCRMLKSRPETSPIFVLQTSATFVTAERKIAGLDSGADGYLTHPFEPAELIATVNSLLRLKHAEEVLRQRADDLTTADKRKDEFLAMLAHELRNPLSAITVAMAQLEHARHDDGRFRAIQKVLARQSTHLARLIDDLLDVSRITRGRIELRRTTIDVRAVLEEALVTNQAHLEGRRQALTLDVSEGPLLVSGDPLRLHQIFSNLVDNASKYSEEGRQIRVSLTQKDRPGMSYAVLRVEDDGVGMPPHFVPYVFDLFRQADESLERTRGGMGIGLTIVKRLVDLHDGYVYARSEGLGKGSQFEVWLPIVPQDSQVAAPISSRPLAGTSTPQAGRRILVIEDNLDALTMLQSLLELHGHDVAIARDGVSGVEMALAGSHDVGIIDIGLPGLNGYEVAAKIRARLGGRSMGLVALTGYGGDDEHRRALQAGFDRHVVKPVQPESFLKLVAELKGPAES